MNRLAGPALLLAAALALPGAAQAQRLHGGAVAQAAPELSVAGLTAPPVFAFRLPPLASRTALERAAPENTPLPWRPMPIPPMPMRSLAPGSPSAASTPEGMK